MPDRAALFMRDAVVREPLRTPIGRFGAVFERVAG